MQCSNTKTIGNGPHTFEARSNDGANLTPDPGVAPE
ncbi:hypothetical protein TNCV_2491171, partial [Trichonephila clavipes]